MDFQYLLSRLDWQQMLSAFIVLFAVIDVLGSTPIFINLKEKGRPVNATKATLISTALMVAFYFAGDVILQLFSVDIESFAVAGSIVIFLMALEMILDIEIFKNMGPIKEATLIPVVFPLLAGPGSFTTLLSLRAEYATPNIMIGLMINMIFVFIVLKATERVQEIISKSTIYLMRKFFGIILLAIAVRLFTSNLQSLLSHL
jgi:multiple antibiotic resistance protein